jgi:hypothetical protein
MCVLPFLMVISLAEAIGDGGEAGVLWREQAGCSDRRHPLVLVLLPEAKGGPFVSLYSSRLVRRFL